MPSSEQKCYDDSEFDSKGSGPYISMVGKTSSPNTEDESKLYTNLLSSVGLDWMFCDREPDQPQETRTLRSRSESLKSSTKAVAASDLTRESRLCSAETAVTDPETRALLDKLMCSPSWRRRGH